MTHTVPGHPGVLTSGPRPAKDRSVNALCKLNRWIVQQIDLEQRSRCQRSRHYARAARIAPWRLLVAALRLRRGLLRRVVLERSPSLLATGRKAFIE